MSHSCSQSRETGMVTAELALGFIPLGLLLGGLAVLMGSFHSYIELMNASHVVTRAISLGTPVKEATQLAQELVDDPHLNMEYRGELIAVTLKRDLSLRSLSIPLSVTTLAWQEDTYAQK